ncbi:MAG: histidine phosphatase family protein [Rhizobiaceae bacterium]
MTEIAEPLFFIRHGQTDWNAETRYQGITDTTLSELGIRQARENAELLQDILYQQNIDQSNVTLMSSPLLRAKQTAEIIGQSFSPQISPAENRPFRELSMGRWEGLTSHEVKERHYEERKSRKLDRWSFKPMGGESMAERSSTIENALNELTPNTVLVTHCVVLRVIFHLLGGVSQQAATAVETPHVAIWCWKSAKLHRQDQK